MSYTFVQVNEFTPNNGGWTPIGAISRWDRDGNTLTLTRADGYAVQCALLGPLSFRIRFRPVANPDYSHETSVAVVSRQLGQTDLGQALQAAADHLLIDTGPMQVRLDLNPFRVRVYRQGQLICADEPSYNLIFIPGQEVVANFKTYPANARYCGFGEKAGAQLFKNEFTLTQFNFDNYIYSSGLIPSGEQGGPLNPTEPLYCSVPLLIEVNPGPQGDFAGAPYCYGIFFDNPAQSYFNLGANDYSDMDGKYYFGALYGELDYYFLLGDPQAGGGGCASVLGQYTTLTGRAPMPPKYVFGYHQGAYGYFDRYVLAKVANAYRAARIPIDGLHIDVDFQNNYRTFTHSAIKFPDAQELFANLHGLGFKCSTNITPLLTNNMLDEYGNVTPYPQRAAMQAINGLIYDTENGGAPNSSLFVGQVSYGDNDGSNPYPYPPRQPVNGVTALGAYGNYSDYGRADVRAAWGQQYHHLIVELGMDMIWQDMMCPAILGSGPEQPNTFPLGLMLNDGNGGYLPNAKIHNIYGMNLLDATWSGIEQLSRGARRQRNFIIARGGYAGMQRYAALWTGDSPSSWDYLSMLVPQVLNIGLSGIPISGADVGGFGQGPIPSGTTKPFYVAYGKVYEGITNYELFVRWMHVGAFLPWYRNHYYGYLKQFQEVYEYGEPVPTYCRKYIEMRYRLIQLFYDAMYTWTTTGLPICRPLFLNDPHDPAAYDERWASSEFFVGSDLLVAPVVTQHITADPPTRPSRAVYLPSGSQWYAYKDNSAPLDAPVPGGTTIADWYAPLDQMPIYVRAGAILVSRELEQYVGQLALNPLTINIYPGPDSSYQLYQDDGIGFDAQDKQAYRLTAISHQGIANGQAIHLQRLWDQYTPPEGFCYVALLGTRHPSSVALGGAALSDVGGPGALAQAPVSAYYWNDSLQTTFIKLFDPGADATVTALFA